MMVSCKEGSSWVYTYIGMIKKRLKDSYVCFGDNGGVYIIITLVKNKGEVVLHTCTKQR